MITEILEEPMLFYFRDEKGTLKINQGKLIDFLEEKGYLNLKVGSSTILTKNVNNVLYRALKNDIVELIRNTLDHPATREVYELYAKSPGTYTGWGKLDLLKSIELIDDRDSKTSSNFFFKNCYCKITQKGINEISYDQLSYPIWQNRIIKKNYERPKSQDAGQFEVFCKNITGKSGERFEAFKSLLGFLLHRNKEMGEQKAIILYDEKMGLEGKANGRTGKTMIANAIGQCREVEKFDGRYLKNEGSFKNQRINLTSDILVYDDLQKNIKFDIFYSMLTTGIEVEKKGQQSYYINEEKAPKILITSNHYVNGDGGESDMGRRYEFEISNYYSLQYTPQNEFGNRFFGNEWSDEEWNKFFNFMFQCVQTYLSKGLIKVDSIRLKKSKLQDKTSEDFVEFAEAYFQKDVKLDKRQLLEDFSTLYPHFKHLTTNMFTRWSQEYADSVNCNYKDKSSGSEYYFWIHSKSDSNE